MPPPRRRRPVQPATRVRLPRTARPAGSPVADAPAEAEPLTGDEVLAEPEAEKAPEAEAPAPADQEVRPADESAAPAEAETEDEESDAGEDTGAEDEDTGAEDEDAEDALPVERADAAGRGRRSLLVPACLAGVAVILGGLAVWFGLEASSAGSGADTQNLAVTDTAATSAVSRQIVTAVNTAFSYNYADTAKTRNAAQAVLTGKAIQQYNTLFKVVQQDAPSEKLVLTTTVTNSGVSMLTSNRAQVLIFANQQDTGGSSRGSTDAGAMFSVDAVLQNGHWKIDNIDTFSAGA